MAFKKGQSGNPAGRPVGTKNPRTKQWEALAKAIREEHTERFNQCLSSLDEKDFIEAYLKVLEYFEPKLSRSEVKAEVESKVIEIGFDE